MSKCEQCIVRELSSMKALNKDELLKIANCKTSYTIKKGESIFEEGEKLNGVFCIKEGVCKMTKLSSNGKDQIIKFVKQVKIGELVLSFDKLSLHEKKSIVDTLPLRLNNDIVDYISKYKEYEQSLLTFADGTRLTIDASFLTSE